MKQLKSVIAFRKCWMLKVFPAFWFPFREVKDFIIKAVKIESPKKCRNESVDTRDSIKIIYSHS